MTSNKLIMMAYDLHGRLFGYMFPLPIIADKSTRHLILNTSSFQKLIPWVSMMLTLLISGYGTCVYLMFTELFHRRKSVNLLNFIIFILAGSMYWATFALNLITFWHAREAVLGTNRLLTLEMAMASKFPQQAKIVTRKFDIRGLVVLSEVAFASCCPLTFTFTGIYEDIDPVYFILRELLPDITLWNFTTILTCLLIRTCILLIGALEAGRSLSLSIAFFISGLEVYTRILQIFGQINRHHFMVYYPHFRMAHYTLKEFMDQFLACGLSCSLIIMVCLLWFSIRSYGKIHWLLYMGFVILVAFLIIATLLCFPRVVQLYECTTDVVKKWKVMSSTKWDIRRAGKRDGMAQAPLYFSCYFFFPFKRSSLVKFYSTVMEYWFTSVILVVY